MKEIIDKIRKSTPEWAKPIIGILLIPLIPLAIVYGILWFLCMAPYGLYLIVFEYDSFHRD